MNPPALAKKKFFSSRGDKSAGQAAAQFSAKAFFSFDDSIVDSGSGPTGSGTSVGSTKTDSTTGSQTGADSQKSSQESEYYYERRIKKAHQCHDLGETEAFDGDIKFYLDGLDAKNNVSTRCLSIMGLAGHCMKAEFRMHLRAHDDMPRIIRTLKDAPNNSNLAFCTAALMFIYNQDRLTMDIDPNNLSLMLELLECRESGTEGVEKRHVEKVADLVKQMKQRGHGKFLDPIALSAGKMTMEALLGLTSKRAGDWFKEELRKLKGIDFLMNQLIKIIAEEDNLTSESELNKADRTLRVLEAATFMHEENQLYVIDQNDGQLIESCIRLMKSNKDNIVLMSESKAFLSSLMSVLRLFTNITSESSSGSNLIGTRFPDLFELFLETLFEVPSFVVPDSRFDLTILLLCLCINLVEFCTPLRSELLKSKLRLERLVDILFDRIKKAQETEQQADELFEAAERNKNEVVNIDTLLNQVVAKSGKHMEHTVIAACISLLLGCSIQEDAAGKDQVTQLLPEKSFEPLLVVLRKLREFANLAEIMTPSGIRRVERILDVFSGKVVVPLAPTTPNAPADSGLRTYSRKRDTCDYSIPLRRPQFESSTSLSTEEPSQIDLTVMSTDDDNMDTTQEELKPYEDIEMINDNDVKTKAEDTSVSQQVSSPLSATPKTYGRKSLPTEDQKWDSIVSQTLPKTTPPKRALSPPKNHRLLADWIDSDNEDDGEAELIVTGAKSAKPVEPEPVRISIDLDKESLPKAASLTSPKRSARISAAKHSTPEKEKEPVLSNFDELLESTKPLKPLKVKVPVQFEPMQTRRKQTKLDTEADPPPPITTPVKSSYTLRTVQKKSPEPLSAANAKIIEKPKAIITEKPKRGSKRANNGSTNSPTPTRKATEKRPTYTVQAVKKSAQSVEKIIKASPLDSKKASLLPQPTKKKFFTSRGDKDLKVKQFNYNPKSFFFGK